VVEIRISERIGSVTLRFAICVCATVSENAEAFVSDGVLRKLEELATRRRVVLGRFQTKKEAIVARVSGIGEIVDKASQYCSEPVGLWIGPVSVSYAVNDLSVKTLYDLLDVSTCLD
jgi:hypothetical protein